MTKLLLIDSNVPGIGAMPASPSGAWRCNVLPDRNAATITPAFPG